MQIVTIFSAIANGGTRFRPTLVDRIGAGAGAPEEPLPSQVIGTIPYTPEQLAVVQDSLYKVTHDPAGTAEFIFEGLEVPVSGKTGTAEAPPNLPHAWFAAYAPSASYTKANGETVTEPEIAIVVMVENSGDGSAVAAPITRQIVEFYYGITPLTPLPWE